MLIRENEYNYLTDINNVKVIQCSSYEKSCNPKHIIDNASKTIWLSLKGFPQSVTFDLTKIIKKPKPCFQYWGIYCWHAYSTNPKEIELQCSSDNITFTSLGYYQLHFKPGMHIFEIEQKDILKQQPSSSNYIKIIIHKACGGDRTYINQLFLFDDFDSMNSGKLLLTPSKNKTIDEESNSNLIVSKKKEEVLITSENERYERYSSENNNMEDKESNANTHTNKNNNENCNIDAQYRTPIKGLEDEDDDEVVNVNMNQNQGDNGNGNSNRESNRQDTELKTLIKETESDIDIEPSDHSKILTALQHMKRIERIFKTKGIPIRNNNTHNNDTQKDAVNQKPSTMPISKNHNTISRAQKKESQYSNYANNSSISSNHYMKLDKELNDLNTQIKTMNFDLNYNYESIYSSNRTRATSNYNRTFNEKNNSNNNSNNNNKDIETRINKVETKVETIEKEMEQIKNAFNDLNEKIEKRTNEDNYYNNNHNYTSNIEEELEGEHEQEQEQRDIYEDIPEDNEPKEEINANKLISSKRNIEKQINSLIDQKFDSLTNQIEEQIYTKYLNPSVKSFEKKVQLTMSQMKRTINKIISRNKHDCNKSSSSSIYNNNPNISSSISSVSSHYNKTHSHCKGKHNYKKINTKSTHKDLDIKYRRINELGEKIYAKLIEKQNKLFQASRLLNEEFNREDDVKETNEG